ncbi:MAG TPA: PQQ-dependent sugar dehydrogenase [Flavobacteriales bacterium]
MKERSTLLATLLLPTALWAQQLNPIRIGLHNWATGLSSPTGLAHAGDDRLFVVERPGRIKIISDSMQVVSTPFLDITDRVNDGSSEQGLLSMVFAPDYATSGQFYVYYIGGTGDGVSRISRFFVTDNPDVADPDSEEIVYTWPQPEWNHNGADLHFGADGYLFCGFGDGGSGNDPDNHAQDLSDPLGDMIRIDVSLPGDTFGIPADNPYANAGGDTLPEIWASGLRNPWRFSIDASTGNMWIGDVGQNAWEEVDMWSSTDHSGANFGWRCREGLVATPGVSQAGCLAANDYVSPVGVFNHSSQGWCSVIGGYVYHGANWPHLANKYIFTDYCAGDFLTFGEDYDVDTLLMTTTAGYAAFGADMDGELYVANTSSGQVRKIHDACPMDAPTVTFDGNELSSTAADSYQWYLNGSTVAGATQQTYVPTVAGNYHVVVSFGAPCTLRSETELVLSTGIAGSTTGSFRIYPQPANDVLFVERSAEDQGRKELQLTDATGRVLRNGILALGQSRISLDITGFAGGAYVLRLIDAATGDARSIPVVIAR